MPESINKILLENQKRLLEAKKKLVLRKQPTLSDIGYPLEQKKRTIDVLKSRIQRTEKMKADASRRYDEQIKSYRTEITRLKGEIAGEKKLLDTISRNIRKGGSIKSSKRKKSSAKKKTRMKKRPR